MNKINLTLIIASILFAVLVAYLIFKPEESAGYYDLVCENAKTLKEYTSCIRLETIINQ